MTDGEEQQHTTPTCRAQRRTQPATHPVHEQRILSTCRCTCLCICMQCLTTRDRYAYGSYIRTPRAAADEFQARHLVVSSARSMPCDATWTCKTRRSAHQHVCTALALAAIRGAPPSIDIRMLAWICIESMHVFISVQTCVDTRPRHAPDTVRV